MTSESDDEELMLPDIRISGQVRLIPSLATAVGLCLIFGSLIL